MLHFAYGAASHVGLVREHNEDAGFAGPYLQLVADGVGGAAAGEVASATTSYVVTALSMGRPQQNAAELLAEGVEAAHRQLRDGTAADETRHGMATTLTALFARDDQVLLVHVGDSRAYRLRAQALTRLSTDHTYVQMLVDRGDLTDDQVADHPYRNVVLSSINDSTPVTPSLQQVDVGIGDRVLVCSDGLTDFVPEDEIGRALEAPDPDDAAGELVDLALAAGGRDNVTCLVADLRDGPEIDSVGRVLGAMGQPWLVVDPGAVSSGGPGAATAASVGRTPSSR